jgi:hypothetical protein
MGSDTRKTPVKSEGKSDEDEKPIGSLFKVSKSWASHRKKTQSENRVDEIPSEVSSGEINDTLASIKKKLKKPKGVKATVVSDQVVEEEIMQELEGTKLDAGSVSVKSGNKRLRINVELVNEEKGEFSVQDSFVGSDEAGLQGSLSVLFKRARKVKNQGTDKLADTNSNGILVESAEAPQEILVAAPEQEPEITSIRDEEHTFPENGKEVQGLEVGLSHCSAGPAEPPVDKCVEEDISKESVSGANLASETEEKEKSQESPVKGQLEEIRDLSREEICQTNVVSGIHEKEKIEIYSVKECSEEIHEIPKGEVPNIIPASDENIGLTCRPCNEPLDGGNFIINDDLSLPANKAFEKSINLEEKTLDISTERQIPGTPDSTRAEVDDMSPDHDEAVTNEPDVIHEQKADEPISGDCKNQSVLLRARKTKKRRHDDMAYEGDADWDVVVNEQVLFNNIQVDQPDQSFKLRDRYLPTKAEEANDGYVAAVAVGLKARFVKPIEKLKFKELLRQKGGLQEYLECRFVATCLVV